MTDFENMSFEEMNSIMKSRWLTSREISKIKKLGIISVEKYKHICCSCKRFHDCYLESSIAGLEADVRKCKFYDQLYEEVSDDNRGCKRTKKDK